MKELINLEFDKKTKKIMFILNIISILFCNTAIILLYIFNKFYISIVLYKSSLIIFRTGLFINIFSIICGIFFTSLKEQKTF